MLPVFVWGLTQQQAAFLHWVTQIFDQKCGLSLVFSTYIVSSCGNIGLFE